MPESRVKPQPSPAGYIPTLDGWRGVAVALVCLAHSPDYPRPFARLGFLHNYGDAGVDLFFALSGLLVCSRLLAEERRTGRIHLAGFCLRRACRILPALGLYLAAIAALGLLHQVPVDWQGWWASLLFCRNRLSAAVGDAAANRLTGHLWSLSLEGQFYLVLPVALVAFAQHRKLALAGLTLASLGWMAIYLLHTPVALRDPIWFRRTDLRLWCLLFPALLAFPLQSVHTRNLLARWTPPSLALFAVAAELLAKLYRLHHRMPSSFWPGNLVFQTEADLWIPLLMPLLALSTLLHPSSPLSRLLEWPPIRSLGRISYGVYLWQQLYFSRAPGWRVFGACAAMALASYFLVEKPCIRLGQRLADGVVGRGEGASAAAGAGQTAAAA